MHREIKGKLSSDLRERIISNTLAFVVVLAVVMLINFIFSKVDVSESTYPVDFYEGGGGGHPLWNN